MKKQIKTPTNTAEKALAKDHSSAIKNETTAEHKETLSNQEQSANKAHENVDTQEGNQSNATNFTIEKPSEHLQNEADKSSEHSQNDAHEVTSGSGQVQVDATGSLFNNSNVITPTNALAEGSHIAAFSVSNSSLSSSFTPMALSYIQATTNPMSPHVAQGHMLALNSSSVADISTVSYHTNYDSAPTSSSNSVKVVAPESNFFIRAASEITGFFNTVEKPKAAAVSLAGAGGTPDTSSFTTQIVHSEPPPPPPPPLVSLIGHEHATSYSISTASAKVSGVYINTIVFESGLNSLYSIQSTALHGINSSANALDINLTGNATGIQAIPYSMRAATAVNPVALTPGGNSTTPGTVLLSNLASNVAVPGTVDLSFGSQNPFVVLGSTTVPASIDAKVTVPSQAANAVLLYNILSTSNASVYMVSDYSPGAVINSMETFKNIGQYSGSGTGNAPTFGVAIQASNNMLVLINTNSSQKLVYVDANGNIGARGLFGVLANVGSVIKEASYNYVKVADVNGDGTSDLLFGNGQADGGLLLYGKLTLPTVLALDQLPSSVSATTFVVPDSTHIVGTPIANNATPLDGGAALNAFPAEKTGVGFAGDVNGDGSQDIMIEKHAVNYSYDSDLLYVVNGQSSTLPAQVELLPYGDSRINQGIIGLGLDSGGHTVQNVHGFIVTGATQSNKVVPNSFAALSIGDMNGDGYNDLLALSNNNKGYLIFGHPDTSDGSANIHLGTSSPYVYQLFSLPDVASSTAVPTIADISAGNVNGDGLNDLIFTSAISSTDLQAQTAFSKYLTIFHNSNGDTLGSILSGAVLTDSSFANAPMGSAYVFKISTGHYDTSHVILGFDNQATLEGFTGIDNIIAGSGNQTLIEHGLGTTNSHLTGVVGSTLIGGDGDNIFKLADPVFHEVRGNGGFDTLKLDSGTLDLTHVPDAQASDLASRASHIVSGIERIELGDNANLIIDPAHLLSINNTADNTPGTAKALVVGSENGSSQDPTKAPSVTLVSDATHHWIESVQSNGNHSFQLNGINANGTFAPMATLVVESNVHSHAS